jgi:hypothetical protein
MREYVARIRRSVARMSTRNTPGASETWIPADRVRIFWFIQTYRDVYRLRKTLARVRKLYPESQAFVVSDGDPDPEIKQASESHSVSSALRLRLFGVEHGGEVVQRMFEAFLKTDADILVKIDPDTDLRRRFSAMPRPSDSSIYGTVQSAGPESNLIRSIQGGCIIVPRHAAILLARSALLESDRLKPPALEWAVDEVLLARARSGLTSYDWTLGWACRELDLSAKNHPEVYSLHRAHLIDAVAKRGAAVSHPRFEIKQLMNPGFYFS